VWALVKKAEQFPTAGFFPWGSFVTWQQKNIQCDWLIERTFVEKMCQSCLYFRGIFFWNCHIFDNRFQQVAKI
jgi:hypothetical protein